MLIVCIHDNDINFIIADPKQEAQCNSLQEDTGIVTLSEDDHKGLYEKLSKHSAKWREIGIYLGFLPSELDIIKARPLLLPNAPRSWLDAMLAEWLQWAPGDNRGSTSSATLTSLRQALIKAGFHQTAQSL